MPSASDIKAGGAFWELYTRNGPLYAGLRAAQARINSTVNSALSIGKRMMGLGAAITGPLIASAKTFASMGDTLDKMSARTGIASESLSEIGFAAEQGGTDLSTFEASIQRMQRSLYNASERGLKAPAEALASLGLSAKALMGLDPEGQFMAIADAMDAIHDPTVKAGAAMQIFGQAGRQLIPMMTGLRDIRQQARDLGLVISTEDSKRAAKFTDQMNILRRVLLDGVFSAGSAVADILGEGIMGIVGYMKAMADWIDQNRALFVTVLKIGGAITAAGAALVGLAGAGMVVSGILGGLASTVSAVGAVLGVVGSVLGFLVSPIGLVIAGLAGLAAYFAYTSGAAGAAADWIMGRFGELWAFVKEVYGGIADAMAAGDMKLAAEVAWAGIRVAWEGGLAWVKTQWAELRFFLVDLWGQAAFGILDTLNDLWAGMVDGFWDVVGTIADAWKWAEQTLAEGIGWILAKLQGLDPGEVVKTLQDDYARQQEGRDDRREARRADLDTATKARAEAIQAARQEWTAGAESKRAAAIGAANQDLDEAKARFAEARQAARTAREKADQAKQEGPEMPDAPDFAGARATVDQGGPAKSASMFSAEGWKMIAEGQPEREAQKTRKRQLAVLERIEQKTGANTIIKEAVPPGR